MKQKFDFTEKEVLIIGEATKNHKFEYRTLDLIYPKDIITKINYFDKCMRLIKDLYHQFCYPEKDIVIRDKLGQLLIDYKELHKELFKLITKYDRNIEWGKHRILRKIEIIFINNKESIERIIDFVFPLAMVRKEFDPNEYVGY